MEPFLTPPSYSLPAHRNESEEVRDESVTLRGDRSDLRLPCFTLDVVLSPLSSSAQERHKARLAQRSEELEPLLHAAVVQAFGLVLVVVAVVAAARVPVVP
jgi:hypothetical protein